jgi:hypothetical protein
MLKFSPYGVGQDDQRGTDQQEKLPVPKGLHFIYPLLNRGVVAAETRGSRGRSIPEGYRAFRR